MRIVFFITLILFLGASKADEEAIYLSEGLQKDFTLDESFKDKKVKLEGSFTKYTRFEYDSKTHTIRFSPQKEGIGILHIKEGKKILKKYAVNVLKVDLNLIAHEVKNLLSEIDGINIKIQNKKVIIDGEIAVPEDMKRIYKVDAEYGNLVNSDLVTLSKAAQNKVAQFMEQEIGDPNITVRATNGKFILRGTVAKEQEKVEAERIAELYAPSIVVDKAVTEGAVRERNIKDVIINLIRVEAPPKGQKEQKKLIQLVVHYIELDKSYDNFFRFQFAPAITDDGTNINITQQTGGGAFHVISSLAATVSNFIPKLNWAKSFGFARVLHSSNIIIEDGGTGSISAETIHPYRVCNAQGCNVQQTSTGINGSVTANIAGPRKDGVNLKMEFTAVNLLSIHENLPITSRRNLSTSLFVRSGLSAAIGGVVSSADSSGYNRSPSGQYEQADPIVNLLASKDFNKKQNQFVVFITPSIRVSASTGTDEIKRKFRLD